MTSLLAKSSIAFSLHTLNRHLAQLSFSNTIRLDFYRSLLLLLNNQVRLNQALKTLYTLYSQCGKKRTAPVAMVIDECLVGMTNGTPFSTVLADWVPDEEGMLLQAGEASGRLAQSFHEIEHIMHAKKRITAAITGAMIYPLVLFAMISFLLNMVATEVVPKLIQIIDPAHWQGAAATLYSIAQFVNHYGLLTLILVAIGGCGVASSLRWLQGQVRIWLDLIPPWSVYRLIHGATFLLNLSALIKSGMQLNIALTQLAAQANPWLQTRLIATLAQLAAGKNLGEALQDTGYHFPDKRANTFLAVIAEYSGLDIALAKFGHSWLEETVQRIEKVAQLLLVGGIFIVGLIMLIVIAGVGAIQDAIQAVSQ